MPLLDLLYIYDATIDFAEPRSASVTIANTAGLDDLIKDLRMYIRAGVAFKRCVVTTHGHPGEIVLNSGGDRDTIGAYALQHSFGGLGLHRLFPLPGSRMYFNGCEVGAGPGGKKFVTAAAQIFFRGSGGTASAMTSNGYPFPLPFVHVGHLFHFTGEMISTTVAPGGIVLPEAPAAPYNPLAGIMAGGI